jgi:ribonuclease P protein component
MNAAMESETRLPDKSQPDQSRKAKQPKQTLSGVRLRKHADFQRAYAASRKRQSASMSWFLARSETSHRGSGVRDQISRGGSGQTSLAAGARVGLTAGKVLGKAHERNRIKRRMREALRRHLDLLPKGADLILHPRRAVLTMEFAKLEAELVRILTQARADAAKAESRARMVSRP